MNTTRMITAAFLLVLVVTTARTQVATSDVIVLQGVLMAANGVPRPDGNYTISVALFNDSTGGIAIWSMTDLPVVQKFGAFSVEMKVDDRYYKTYQPGKPVYGNITIDGVELKPRLRIASVPLAHRARYADDGAGQVPVGSVTAFAGDTSRIPEGWLLCDGSVASSESFPLLAATLDMRYNDEGGEGQNLFRLPDMRGMVVVGAGTNRLDGPSDSFIPKPASEGIYTRGFDRKVNARLPHVELHYIIRAR